MASERQLAANRENAKKSTGPKTPEGRAAVRLNGVKHGLSAETLVLMGENQADFDALIDSLQAEHQPATPTEELLVRQLAMAAWRQLRLYRAEAGFIRNEDRERREGYRSEAYLALHPDCQLGRIAIGDAVNQNVLLNFHRFEVRLERSMRHAIHELRRCRADRFAQDDVNQAEAPTQSAIGFGLHPAPIEPPSSVAQASEPSTEAPPDAAPLAPAA